MAKTKMNAGPMKLEMASGSLQMPAGTASSTNSGIATGSATGCRLNVRMPATTRPSACCPTGVSPSGVGMATMRI